MTIPQKWQEAPIHPRHIIILLLCHRVPIHLTLTLSSLVESFYTKTFKFVEHSHPTQ
jgi:hypothetical protein